MRVKPPMIFVYAILYYYCGNFFIYVITRVLLLYTRGYIVLYDRDRYYLCLQVGRYRSVMQFG